MKQLQLILNRIKNPSVLISVVSQFVAILMLLNINIDGEMVSGVVTGISSILVLLGILSNPDTETAGFGDDIHFCESCNKEVNHLRVADKLVCKDCGFTNTKVAVKLATK